MSCACDCSDTSYTLTWNRAMILCGRNRSDGGGTRWALYPITSNSAASLLQQCVYYPWKLC